MPHRAIESRWAQAVSIPHGRERLAGELTVPSVVAGVVLLAHDEPPDPRASGHLVAGVLHEARLATLRLDPPAPGDGADPHPASGSRHGRDLAAHLIAATDWLAHQERTARLPVGYFAAGSGAGAALDAAARVERVGAVVVSGGRPDLAPGALATLHAPTLLIVGEHDPDVLELNRLALRRLTSGTLLVVPEASHRFEEAGALEVVAHLASMWFQQTLAPGS
ncbi:MAG: alpha/beta hydrolase [Myxococcales bacterium]|nr:MAG: alpha/beta hydrolase [Myxococcales bacterium]